MRYLVIVMMVPLLLGGCLGSFAADFGKGVGGHMVRGLGRDVPYLGARWRREKRDGAYWSDFSAGSKKPGTCFNSNNVYACLEEWKELSDEDFCKRYSFANRIVAQELARRKLDCSKLTDSASSK